ncbi:MAG: hypothetical protein NC131_14260 [Roseburia sp.]|nr:hypothetical protein [Roseburia sp.]
MMKMRRKMGDTALELIKTYETAHRTAFRIPSQAADAPELTDKQLVRLCQKYADAVDSINMPHGLELSDDQRDALISFAYDMGISNLRKLIKVPFDEIADEMTKYDKVDGVVYPGLTQRRFAEAELFGGLTVTPPEKDTEPENPEGENKEPEGDSGTEDPTE